MSLLAKGWIHGYIGMLKTLQHSGKLSESEEKLYGELLTEDGPIWVSTDGPARHYASPTLDFILITGQTDLQSQQVKNALESMRDGVSTFMDQKITKELVDHLSSLYHASRAEERAIGAPYA